MVKSNRLATEVKPIWKLCSMASSPGVMAPSTITPEMMTPEANPNSIARGVR